jgi:hypothetical protein
VSTESDYTRFRSLLESAVRSVGPEWFSLSVAGGDDIVRERNFCYELHHQLRVAMDGAGVDLSLGAELDKRGHRVINSNANPDLVLHEAGTMDRNVCVVEVKPITGAKDGFKKDVRNLRQFVGRWSYHVGILLIYGTAASAEQIIRSRIGVDVASLREERVFVLWIASARAAVVELQ